MKKKILGLGLDELMGAVIMLSGIVILVANNFKENDWNQLGNTLIVGGGLYLVHKALNPDDPKDTIKPSEAKKMRIALFVAAAAFFACAVAATVLHELHNFWFTAGLFMLSMYVVDKLKEEKNT